MRFSEYKAAQLALAFLLLFPVLLSNNAFSHGDAPSSCENRYDAKITSMTIDNGTAAFDPFSNSELEFNAQISKGYDVTFTMHTANVSLLNNTLAGTTWYRHSAFGFGSGACVNDAGPKEDISVTVHVAPPSGVPDGFQQNTVEWGSWPEVVQLTYAVTWHSSTPEQELQQNHTSPSEPLEQLVEDSNDSRDNELEDEQESEDNDDFEGIIMSPFIFRDEALPSSSSVRTATPNVIVEQLPSEVEDALKMNGTLASYPLVPSQTGKLHLHILSGNWSMAMNDTAVVEFDANFTVLRYDGADRQTGSLSNLTAVNQSNMNFDSDKISINSTLDYYANATKTRVNATISLYKLNVISIELREMNMPIYGIIDKVVVIRDGQTLVIQR